MSFWLGFPAYPRPYSYYDYAYPGWTARPNHAASGAMLGALAGAVIGNNSGDLGHSAWRGAALGAVAGLAAGSWAEHRARERDEQAAERAERARAMETISPPESATQNTAEPVRPIEKTSRMAEANRLFGR